MKKEERKERYVEIATLLANKETEAAYDKLTKMAADDVSIFLIKRG